MTDDLERRLRSAMKGATDGLVASPDLGVEVGTRARTRAQRAGRARAAGAAGVVAAVAGLFVAVTSDSEEDRRVRTVTVPTTAAVTAPEPTTTPTTAPPPNVVQEPPVPPGALDSSFGAGGRVTTFFEDDSGPSGSSAESVAVDGAGRLVVAGSLEWGDESADGHLRVVLARYLPDGRLDPSFGDGGRAVTDVKARPSGLFVLDDGRLLVVGTGVDGVVIARFEPDGEQDPAPGRHVTVACPVGRCTAGRSVRQPDGHLLVPLGMATVQGNEDNVDGAVFRLDPDGQVDQGYGDGGVARLGPGGAAAVAVDGLGRAVVVGGGPLVARLTPSGAIDPSFGNSGVVTVDLDREFAGFRAVAVLPDGRVLAAGSRGDHENSEIVLMRLQPDGRTDPSFGPGGVVTTARPSLRASASSLLVDPAGNAVIAGVDGEAMLVARYDAHGQLDRSFGDRGVTEVHFGGRTDGAAHVIRLADGRLVAAGYAFSVEHNYGFGIARLGG